MTTKYLLPCDCGQKNEVLPSQAGFNITCACGRQLLAPTLKHLRKFEAVVGASPETPANAWEPRHTVRFIGALLALLGIGWGLYVVLNPTVLEPEETGVPEVVLEPLPQAISPVESLFEFQRMKQMGIPPLPPEPQVQRTQAEKLFSVICFVVGGIGIIMLATAGLIAPPQKSRPPIQ